MKWIRLLALSLLLAVVACRWGPSSGSRSHPDIDNKDAPLPMDSRKVSLGFLHSCALRSNNQVFCWGNGDYGQLGNGRTLPAIHPVDVHTSEANSSPLGHIVSVSAGHFHTCALTERGRVKCWGNGEHGQLGNNETADSPTPVGVQTSETNSSPLRGIVAISAGRDHTCALTRAGNVKCWGNGEYGQLGEGTVSDSELSNSIPIPAPVDVRTSATNSAPLSNIVAISSGGLHTCALTRAGNVKCWGSAYYGQLGNGTLWGNRSTPVNVRTSITDPSPLGGIVAISAGGGHTCALTEQNHVKCWGWRDSGQLGDRKISTIENSPVPVDVHTSLTSTSPLGHIVAISAGTLHTCAVTDREKVKCWGSGLYGQLGNRMSATRSTPVNVHASHSDSSSLDNIADISMGGKHSCALTNDGDVKCWGNGEHGQLGNGEVFAINSTPSDVLPD